jgi:hypothetical protein
MRGTVLLAACWALLAAEGPAAAQDAGKPGASDDALIEASQVAILVDLFALAIPADQRVRREIFFGGDRQNVIVIVNRALLAEADQSAAQRIHVSRSFLPEGFTWDKMVRLFSLQLGTGDDSIFTLRCFSTEPDGSFCTFAGLPQSPHAGYAIAGEWFVIPGDGCIYSRAGPWETYMKPIDTQGLNCLSGGALRPALRPPGNTPRESNL